MKASLLLCFLGALASASAYCEYADYICSTGVSVASPGTTKEDCFTACESDGGCLNWTFKDVHGVKECYLLTDECALHENCFVPGNCQSGPKTCVDPCPQLDYNDVAQESKTWSCIMENNPYSVTIPPTTVCEISCPTWMSDGNPFPGTIKATCDGPGWTVDPTTATDQDGTAIIPDANPLPKCTCPDIPIPKGTLESGENGGGAELYINNVKTDNINADVTIKGTDHVVLLCDRHPVMDFSCMNGVWSDGVIDCKDIYCYTAPTTCEAAAPTPPTTTATPPPF